MHIVSCFKVVPEEQDIVVTPDQKLSFDRADFKISQFDLNGIEAAVQLAGEGDVVTALSVGGKILENSKLKKDVLSRGPSELCLVKDDAAFEGALAETTASAIAAAARTTGFDLLVFGEGSGDLYAQQTGLLAARMLGVPCVNAVSSIEKTDAGIRVERSLENEVEVIELPLPAAVCVTSDINVPRIPTMKAILGAVVNAVVPCESCAAELRACGPAAVYNLGLAEGEAIENYAETIASLAQGEGNLFLFDATRRSKALAAGVAAKRGAGLVNDALSLEAGDAVKATFRTYGGLAAAAVRIVSADAVVTVGAGVFEPEPADASADIPVIAVEKVAPAAAIVVKERRAKAAASVDLTKAKRVIGIGRGIAKQEDIAMIEAFAKAIGAEIGCSRPIAEGEHWMERERYIGVSGTQLKADIYIALGISGQIQHMVGAADCGVILAVNKDKNAPIFKDADAGIVGDLYKIVPELTRALS